VVGVGRQRSSTAARRALRGSFLRPTVRRVDRAGVFKGGEPDPRLDLLAEALALRFWHIR
jgi:hypothetical protein